MNAENPVTLTLGSGTFKSTYTREEGIVFHQRPTKPWHYLATGTGRTGVAVITHDGLALQINHEGAYDELGWLKPVVRIMFDLDGDPLSQAARNGSFRMTHDLSRSVILIEAPTSEGKVSVEVRADMTHDLIRIDIQDKRSTPGVLRADINPLWEKALTGSRIVRQEIDGSRATFWHNNGPETEWHRINMASGIKEDSDFIDPLANRCFGVCVFAGNSRWKGQSMEIPTAPHRVVYVAAEAKKGEQAFHNALAQHLDGRPGNDTFIDEHEDWWRQFWGRVWFHSDASMKKHMAAYDFNRYFNAVASGKNREFPVRFQIPLLSSTSNVLDESTQAGWQQMHINAVQSIEAYWPSVKNGDWDQLHALWNFYRRTHLFYCRYTHDYFEHPGVFIPYETNPWGSVHFTPLENGCNKDMNRYHLDHHKWGKYSFEHGPALMLMALQEARSRGDTQFENEFILPYMRDLCSFFIHHYSRDSYGKIVFDPATSGETWYNVRNPASWILLFQTFLPKVVELAKRQKDDETIRLAEELSAALPELPIGEYNGEKMVIRPADTFDRHEPINHENPELYGIWPYDIYGIGMPEYELALRSFQGRKWKNFRDGWNLDVIWAARLGLTEEVLKTYETIHFPSTYVSPGGFARECAPIWPGSKDQPLYPSMQGMGASICHLYEMVCQDRDGAILVMPAWPKNKPLSIAMYSSAAGRVEIEYTPGQAPKVITERPVRVILPQTL